MSITVLSGMFITFAGSLFLWSVLSVMKFGPVKTTTDGTTSSGSTTGGGSTNGGDISIVDGTGGSTSGSDTNVPPKLRANFDFVYI